MSELIDEIKEWIEKADHDLKFRNAFILNNFSIQIRYPNKIIKLSKEELENAIQISEEFRIFSVNIVGLK